MDQDLQLNLIMQSVATFGMLGVIWLVQLGTYPLQIYVAKERFAEYQARYMPRVSLVVGPLMLVESGTAVWLLNLTLTDSGRTLAWIGVGLVMLLWLSTLLLQIPCHWKLEREKDEAVIGRLVATNWIRTVAWTARAVVVVLLWRECLTG